MYSVEEIQKHHMAMKTQINNSKSNGQNELNFPNSKFKKSVLFEGRNKHAYNITRIYNIIYIYLYMEKNLFECS